MKKSQNLQLGFDIDNNVDFIHSIVWYNRDFTTYQPALHTS